MTIRLPPKPAAPTILESQSTIVETETPASSPPAVSFGEGEHFVPIAGSRFKDWTLIEPIAATSAEADIWLMQAADSKTKTVLKLYRYGIQPKPEILAAVKKLRAKSVVQVLDYGEVKGRHYEVQEFAEPGTLEGVIKSRSIEAMPTIDVLRELHSALADVHECGIIHRDLKPSNIFIRSREPVDLILADFGISSLSDLSLHLSNTNRTAAYAAPEAMTGVVAKASDWWSLGVILIEILTGKHPFAGLDERTINFALVSRGISIPSGIESEWVMLLKGLLTRDHEKRWGAAEVGRWLDGDRNIPLHFISGTTAKADGNTTGYSFAGSEYHDLHTLALAMAEDWDEAVKRVSRRFLVDWVRDYFGDDDLSNTLQDIVEDRQLDEDQKVCATLMALDPSLPMVWRSEVITPEWIALKVDVQELPTLRMQNHEIDDDDIELIRRSIEIIRDEQFASPTLLQSRLNISLEEANVILNELHERNVVGPKQDVLARDVLIGREDGLSLSVRLLESSLPDWLQKFKQDEWMLDLAAEHREAWAYLRRSQIPVNRTIVDQLLLSPHRDAVWPLLEERRSKFLCSTHEAIQGIFASEEFTRLDAIAIVATDEEHFQSHTEAELSNYILWLDTAGIHYNRTEAEDLICNPDIEEIAAHAQTIRDAYTDATPPALDELLTKDPLEFIEAIALVVARRDHFETALEVWIHAACSWIDRERKLRVEARTHGLSRFILSMNEARKDQRRWDKRRRELVRHFDDLMERHERIIVDSVVIDEDEQQQAAKIRSKLLTASAEQTKFFQKRFRSTVSFVWTLRFLCTLTAVGAIWLAIRIFV